MDRKAVLAILCIALMTLSCFLVFGNAASEGPKVIDCRELAFYDEMEARLEAYGESHDWRLKVHPSDLEYLENVTAETPVYVEAYVSRPREAVEYSIDCSTNETVAIYLVYQATDEQVEEFLKVPHDSFYKSKFQPCVCMEVTAKDLETIAQLPFVYCIRVGPREIPIEAPDEPIITSGSVTIEQARTYDKIKYVLQNKDSTVDKMQIAVIDTGYDPYDEKSKLGGVAEDNIAYKWDFYHEDGYVNEGDNSHGTNCLDLIARAFGDTGKGKSMYEEPAIYYVLKAGPGPEILGHCCREAIEWCLGHDPEVVSMSWGTALLDGSGPNFACLGWWCDLFEDGVQQGITWVASSGNDGAINAASYPSISYFVIGVGSYDYVKDDGTAPRSSFSNYGKIYYSRVWEEGLWIYCDDCYYATGDGFVSRTRFKPDVYDAGRISEVGSGTSYATPLVAACIAMGVYSAKEPGRGQDWVPGYSNVLSAVHKCHTYLVKPDESSLQGDIMDCLTLYNDFD